MSVCQYYPLKDYFPDAHFIDCDPDAPFQGFCHDSRQIKEGELFLAFQGLMAHGYSFHQQALTQGALATVVDSACPLPINGPAIIVPNVLEAAKKAAIYHRMRFPGRIYAVTGTAGKTSTKEYFAQIMQQCYPETPFFISHENWNNTLGLTVNISRLPLKFISNLFELGISAPGDMDELVDILRPNGVIITSIGEAHLDQLHNCQGIALEKQKIARYADKGWTTEEALQYLDNKYIQWGVIESEHYEVQPLLEQHVLKTELSTKKRTFSVYSSGVFHYKNFLLALAVIESQQRQGKIKNVEKVFIIVPKGRGSLEVWGAWHILDDTYNASIPALRSLLQLLRQISTSVKVGLVISDLNGLGKSEELLLNNLFDTHPAIAGRLCYYYTGKDPKAWIRRGAIIFDKDYFGVRACFEHARNEGIRFMAFKASRKSGLEVQMGFFIQNIQSFVQKTQELSS